jgi:signal transduction histidine kinase
MATHGWVPLQEIDRLRQGELVAEERERERELFVSMLGHDLRNPLSTILAGLEMLKLKKPTDDRDRVLIDRLHGSGLRMARMIDQLLDFARSRLGGGIPLERRFCDLGELCVEVAAELDAAGGPIPVDRSGDTSGEWDRDRLGEVISNLVGNALAHGEPHTARLVVDGLGDEVLLECRNRGAIAADELPHLFDPFRGGHLHGKRSSGLGLGLYIVARIVEEHHGHIEVRSSVEEGTRFIVRLPRR